VSKGWKNESERHSLSAKGIRTGRKSLGAEGKGRKFPRVYDYDDELEAIGGVYDKYAPLNWNDDERAKEIFDSDVAHLRIPLTILLAGMVGGRRGKLLVAPFPNLMFRFASKDEWRSIQGGGVSGGFWGANPITYQNRERVLLVSETRPSFHKYTLDQDAPSGYREPDEILAVYDTSELGAGFFRPIFVREGFDIGQLEHDYGEKVMLE